LSESSERPIRVLLVDDHAVVRKGLRALLDREPSIEVVGEAEHGEQAVRAADRVRPDVVLMDLEMPGLNGIEATRRIVESHPDARSCIDQRQPNNRRPVTRCPTANSTCYD